MYRHVCTITFMSIPVHTWYIHVYKSMYMYKHVYAWYIHVYTILPNPVHMVRIPDGTRAPDPDRGTGAGVMARGQGTGGQRPGPDLAIASALRVHGVSIPELKMSTNFENLQKKLSSLSCVQM